MALDYRILLDTLRDYTFTGYFNDISTSCTHINMQSGAVGVYDPVAAPAYLELRLSNANGDFNLQNPSAKYYGRVRRGTLVKVQASLNGGAWTTLSVLKINSIVPTYTMQGDHELTVKATDILQDFLNQEFVPPLQTNVRVDQILDKVHETRAAIWPYESYYQFIGHTSIGDGKSPFDGSLFTDFETAETSLPFYGDNLDKGQGVRVQQYLKDAVAAEIFGLYWFSPRNEFFHALSRYHAADTAVTWNIDTTITDVPVYTYGRDLVNDYSLSYYPRAIGDEASVLWTSENVPFQIAAQSYKRITVRYRDPNIESAAVGALEVIDLVRGTDFIANSESDGSGDDWSRFISASLIKGAASSEILFYNRKVGDPAHITFLQIRGTPITAYNKETVYGYNDDSIFGVGSDESTGNDRASGSESLYAVSDIVFAQDYADFKVAAYGDPTYAIERLTIPIKSNDDITQAKVLSHSIGDVINFQDDDNQHDSDYMIVGEKHTITPNTTPATHIVTYTLRPSLRAGLFVLDESSYGGGDTFAF
jgi:hypothetical protein